MSLAHESSLELRRSCTVCGSAFRKSISESTIGTSSTSASAVIRTTEPSTTTAAARLRFIPVTFESQRTSTFQLAVLPEGQCEFPPLEKNAARAQAIVVHATSAKQGKKLPELVQAGMVQVEGNPQSFGAVVANIMDFDPVFNIVTP